MTFEWLGHLSKIAANIFKSIFMIKTKLFIATNKSKLSYYKFTNSHIFYKSILRIISKGNNTRIPI